MMIVTTDTSNLNLKKSNLPYILHHINIVHVYRVIYFFFKLRLWSVYMVVTEEI